MLETYTAELEKWCETHHAQARYEYQVPLLGEGGTCSLFGELDEKPFDLSKELNQAELDVIPAIQSICDWVEQKANVDWFGIYLTRTNQDQQRVLTKLGYFGAPSRAEFPLNPEFAQISNNSAVGLYGEFRTINDVEQYIAQGGEYYTCDPKVKSELCWPIVACEKKANNSQIEAGTEQKILGIIDAECFQKDRFDQDLQALFVAVSQKLSVLFSKLS